MKRFLAAVFSFTLLLTALCACGNATTTAVTEKVDKGDDQLEIVSSGYTVLAPDSIGDIYLTYAVTIRNNSRKLAAQFPEITVTGRKEDGSILFSEDQSLGTILPGDTVSWADDFIDCKGIKPASVEIVVAGADFVSPEETLSKVVESSNFKIENLSEIPDEYDTSVTGEITNNSDTDFDTVAVTVILKNQDKVVGGFSDYVDHLSAHKQSAFEISSFSSELPAHDSIEVVAHAW